jgi:ATP-binding cassette subfamily B protein
VPASPSTRLLVGYLRPERARLAILLGGLLAAMLLPLAGPWVIGHAVDAALGGAAASRLGRLALAYLVVSLTGQVLRLWVTRASVRMAWRTGNLLRSDLATHVLHLDQAWHTTRTPGLLIERVDGDVDALAGFFQNIVLEVVGNGVLLVGVLVLTSLTDWRIGLALGVLSAIATGVLVKLRTVAVAAHDERREAAAALYGDLEERLAGLEDLRANGAGRYAVHRLMQNEHRAWRAARHAALRSSSAYAAAATIFSLGTVAVLALAVAFEHGGRLTPGTVFVLYRYSQLTREPLERLAEQLRDMQKAIAGANRAASILSSTTAVPEPTDPVDLPVGALSVDLDHLGFAYPDDLVPVLVDVDLHVEPGQTLGVVGRTGSGKTSLGRLLLRLWDPTTGAVRVGGLDLRDVRQTSLRRRVAVVTQDVQLVTGTVRDNVTLYGALPGDDDALVGLLAELGLGRWLADVGGLDGVVHGTGGLSAGEAQLVAFARAFLSDPGLVILDEASSRLDPATEAKVNAATERLLEGRTAVIIAHRLATLDRADRVLVLEHGRVVEEGDRAALADDRSSRWAGLLRTAGGEEVSA